MESMTDFAESVGDTLNASKGKIFSKSISIFSAFIDFSERMDNAGKGVLSKRTDIITASISLVANLVSTICNKIFGPVVSYAISAIGDIVPKVFALRINGLILM